MHKPAVVDSCAHYTRTHYNHNATRAQDPSNDRLSRSAVARPGDPSILLISTLHLVFTVLSVSSLVTREWDSLLQTVRSEMLHNTVRVCLRQAKTYISLRILSSSS